MRFRLRTRGFSLLECLCTMVLVWILARQALPVYRDLMQHNQSRVVQAALLDALELARHAAVVSGREVVMVIEPDGIGVGEVHFYYLATQHLRWRTFSRDKTRLRFLATGELRYENGTFEYGPLEKPDWQIKVSKSGRARVV